MTRKQRRSLVVAELLGLCVSLWSVSAMAECQTYQLSGDLWFSDRRGNDSLSQALWLTMGPAPNVEVELRLGAEPLPPMQDFEASQPAYWLCPAGVDCNSETFDDYEGARNIYTDLNGHWSADVILCLRKPAGEYGIHAQPIFKMQTPEWNVINEHFDVYQVFGRAKAVATANGTGALEFGITVVPWFTRLERAMWIFQMMRDAWNFVEVDGGCPPERGFQYPCGFDLKRSTPVPLMYAGNKDELIGTDFECWAAYGCGWKNRMTLNVASATTVYHEYGHVALHNAVRNIQAEIPEGDTPPWAQVHEDWANVVRRAILNDDFSPFGEGEGNLCDWASVSPYMAEIFVDLYDRGEDRASLKLGVGASDRVTHGAGQILFTFSHMSDQELISLRDIGNQMNEAYFQQTQLERASSLRAYVEELSARYNTESTSIWSWADYRLKMWELFLMNCVVL